MNGMTRRYADNYSRNLKLYLDGEGISTNSLANKTNISQKTIWVVQAGKSVPTVNTIQSISDALPIDGRVMLGKELTLDQLQQTAKIGRIMDDLIELTADQVSHVRAITKAFMVN
jgi:transcriptional regulator with XRE-family HTH domain